MKRLWQLAFGCLVAAAVLALAAGYLPAEEPDGWPAPEADDWWEGALAPRASVAPPQGQATLPEPFARPSAATTGTLGLIWTRRADMPTARSGLGLAATSYERVYAIGGGNNTVGSLPIVEEYEIAAKTWTTRASMGVARSWLGVAEGGNGKIYAIGGCCLGTYAMATVEEYDPQTDVWVYRAKMPTARYALGVTAVKGKVYAIGGAQSSPDRDLATVEEYDPASNSWSTRASMPTARRAPGLATLKGKIYVIGGTNLRSHLATVEEYDPATDTWTTRASMPTPRNGPAVVAANNGKIYALGGWGVNGVVGVVEEYDPATDTWTTLPGMPTARQGLAVAAAGDGRIYLVGGATSDGIVATVDEVAAVNIRVYLPFNAKAYQDPVSDDFGSAASGWPIQEDDIASRGYGDGEYRILVKQPNYIVRAGRSLLATDFQAEVDGRAVGHTNGDYGLYFASGDAGFYAFQVRNDFFRLVRYELPTDKWTTLLGPIRHGAIRTGNSSNRLKVDRSGSTVTLYVNGQQVGQTADSTFGPGFVGLAAGGYEADYEARFDNFSMVFNSAIPPTPTPTPTWTPTPSPTPTPTPAPMVWRGWASMPTARSGLAAVTAGNGKIYAIGGSGMTGVLATVEEYDPATDTWRARSSMPTPRSNMGAVAASNGKIYVIGGWGSGGVVATVEEYDPASDAWASRASMPTARSELGLAESHGRIYALGGFGTVGSLDTVEEYDPATNTWRTVAAMPTARYRLGAASSNSKIYTMGGVTTGSGSDLVEEYDPSTGIWRGRARLPYSVEGLRAVTASNGKIYALGWSSTRVAEYDPVVNNWKVFRTSLSIPSSQGLAPTNDGRIYSIGGYGERGDGSWGLVGTVMEATVP